MKTMNKKAMIGWASAQIISMLPLTAFAAGYSGPLGGLSKEQNQAVWSKYCVGTADSNSVPGVNYAEPKVKRAAQILSTVADLSFYFYSGPLKAYGVKQGSALVNAPSNAPSGTTPHAHAFLTVLCGEFRDRAGMVEAKIGWVNNMFLLPKTKQGPVDPKKNVWAQLSAQSYGPYLQFSKALHDAKAQARAQKTLAIGDEQIDTPINGQIVCETKYLVSNYVAAGKKFDSLSNYLKGYNAFASANCTADEKDSYYVFRGDSNFKPNSPESNGMIWYSSSIANHCSSPSKAADSMVTDADCAKYFRAPFKNRWNAARAGLAGWLFYDTKRHEEFGETSNDVTVLQGRELTKPFSLKFPDGKSPSLRTDWTKLEAYGSRDAGFNTLVGIEGGGQFRDREAYELLRDAVNRHTDWYHSKYDDQIDPKKGKRDQAYSPFVASSYEMSASDNFTAPGTTVNSPSDGKKHWMFVFRVKKSNWYTSDSVGKRTPVNFDLNWFDETSLGTNHLAKSERAWDRLGTALESELDSILYLHNISTYGEVQ